MLLHIRLSITPPTAAGVAPNGYRFPCKRPAASRFPRIPLALPVDLSTRWRHRSSSPLTPRSSVVPADAGDEVVGGVFDDELSRLLVLLPPEMRRKVETHAELRDLVEVVMDLGRQPLARFPSGDVFLSDRPISYDDLHHATSQVGDFAADNRAGISRTLHRISAIRNRKGTIVGLTCRVGRAVAGSANLLRDLIKDGGSLLLIGPPGVGKTTIIREIARMLADDYKRRVVIVDTSNEIGGDGDIPHAGIGNARRLQVPNPDMQHKVLIEAVENHMPQVIVIDEIGTRLEAMAASTIAQRGIQLVATAHGVAIENLIMNPSLEMLVGGIQSVTLGDEEANRRGGQKTVRERKGPSTFNCGAEIVSKTEIRVHRCLESTVDALLAGRSPNFEIRKSNHEGNLDGNLESRMAYSYDAFAWEQDNIKFDDHSVRLDDKLSEDVSNPQTKQIQKQTEKSHEAKEASSLFVYGIMETSVQEAVKQLGMDGTIEITNNMSEAAAFLALQSKLKKNPHIHAVARSREIPIFVTKTNSLVQIMRAVRALVNELPNGLKASEVEEGIVSAEEADALEEARLAIEHVVIPRGEPVQLLPRPSNLISIQVELIEKYKLLWEIVGEEPNVYVRVFPHQTGTKQRNVSERVDKNIDSDDFNSSDDAPFSQNGMTRLPLLPE